MDIWAADKLILFIAFVIPGFISIKCYQLLQPGVVRNAADQVVDAIAYSCINYALFLWLIFAVERSALRDAHPLLYGIFYVVVLLVGPVIWAVMWRWMRSWEVFQRNAPHPTAKP